ncbi:MAG: Glycosyl transferase family 2 [uncultured Thiotrichaceae bacterium]|uniref:Glycosyl transferase family 2 n=1 Tax=uncultured Thiotrichaceae bacterium TaxID=298394 RepID=A0A6S6TNN8_9GAMM|nr:MAG: Glycosyl transferase family 2 [uncultured Thiotrichaceae bacterium]
MASIIVPAHNEASGIAGCLESLIQQPGVDKIIVACNGCTDTTVMIVQQYSDVLCLDIETPSKVNALNEAEKHIQSWPVFYIDADTRLSAGAVEKICAAMESGELLLAAPEPVIDTSASSWWVRQYYSVWLSLPYIRDGVVATCSFVISEQGRKRFAHFPPIINDDGFVRCQFSSAERGNVAGSQVFITAPKDLYSLIKIKTRARLGNMQLSMKNLCTKAERKPYSSILLQKLLSTAFVSVVIYISITTIIRLRAKQQLKNIDTYQWETDKSSRQKV